MSRPISVETEIVASKACADGKGREFVAYQVRVRYRDHSWLVDKRYRQFVALNHDLARLDALRVVETQLPGRRFLGKLKQDSLTRRRDQLNEYLQAVVQAYMNMSVEARAVVRQFVEIPTTITDTPSVTQPSWDSDDDLFDENDLEWDGGEDRTLYVQLDQAGEDELNRPTLCVVQEYKKPDESFQYKPGTQLVEYAVTFHGLRNALANGDMRAVDCILLQEPSLVRAKDEQGNTALHFAAMYNQVGIATALIDRYGADAGAENNEGQCYLTMALPEMRHILETTMARK